MCSYLKALQVSPSARGRNQCWLGLFEIPSELRAAKNPSAFARGALTNSSPASEQCQQGAGLGKSRSTRLKAAPSAGELLAPYQVSDPTHL